MAEEGMKKTKNELIHIGKPIPFNTEVFLLQLTHLAKACNRNSEDIVGMVEEMVTTFHPAGEKNEKEMRIDSFFKEQKIAMKEAAATVLNTKKETC